MKASFIRETKETRVEVSLDLDGREVSIHTGIELLDRVLESLAQSAQMGLEVVAQGDLATGDHHTVEDVGITAGSALAELIMTGMGPGNGYAMVPSGHVLATAAVKFGEPGYLEEFSFVSERLGGMELENFSHFMRALAYNGHFNLYLGAKGDDDWRKAEAMAAALGSAMRAAFKVSGMTFGQKYRYRCRPSRTYLSRRTKRDDGTPSPG